MSLTTVMDRSDMQEDDQMFSDGPVSKKWLLYHPRLIITKKCETSLSKVVNIIIFQVL